MGHFCKLFWSALIQQVIFAHLNWLKPSQLLLAFCPVLVIVTLYILTRESFTENVFIRWLERSRSCQIRKFHQLLPVQSDPKETLPLAEEPSAAVAASKRKPWRSNSLSGYWLQLRSKSYCIINTEAITYIVKSYATILKQSNAQIAC